MKVALRADATNRSGAGHVMRCLALADELRRQGAQTLFVCRELIGRLPELIAGHGHALLRLPAAPRQSAPAQQDPSHPAAWLGVSWEQDAADTVAALGGEGGADWVVVDHYALDARWQRLVRAQARKVMVMDDLANRVHDADVLLDQNLYADAGRRYRALLPAGCRQLLGPGYALLRPEFALLHRQATERQGPVRRLLVLMGGTDADNLTSVVLQAIGELALPALEVDVVIGSAHPARDEVQARCAARPGTRLHVDSADVAALMAGADLAVGAGGTATWERCAVGLPTLALCVADNQRQLLQDASLAGLLLAPAFERFTPQAIALQLRALIDNPALRQLLSRRALATVDGGGAARVAQALRTASLTLAWRRAELADAQALLAWRNDPAVRNASHGSAEIGFEAHCAWLARVLSDPERHLLIGLLDGAPAGVVRFDVQGPRAEISIYRVPGRAERGLGSLLLASAEAWLRQHRPGVSTIVAEVRAGNDVSRAMFERGGYQADMLRYHKVFQA